MAGYGGLGAPAAQRPRLTEKQREASHAREEKQRELKATHDIARELLKRHSFNLDGGDDWLEAANEALRGAALIDGFLSAMYREDLNKINSDYEAAVKESE